MARRLIGKFSARNRNRIVEIAVSATIAVEVGLGQHIAAGIGPGFAGGDDPVAAGIVAVEGKRHQRVGNCHAADGDVAGILHRYRVVHGIAGGLTRRPVIVVERACLDDGQFRSRYNRHFLADNGVGKLIARNRGRVVEVVVAAARRIEIALLQDITAGPAPGLTDIQRPIRIGIAGGIENQRDERIAGGDAG